MFKSQCIGCLSLPREHPEYGRIWGSPTGKKAHQPQALLFPLTSMCFILSSLQLLSSFSLGQNWEEVGRERSRARERASERVSERAPRTAGVSYQAASRGCAPADCCFLSGTSLLLPSAACLIPSCPEPGPRGGGVGSQLLHCAGSPAVPAFPCPAPTRPELCTLMQGLAPPPGTSTAACHLTQPPSLPQGSPGKAAAKDCSQASAAKAHSPSHACFPFSLFRP